jgi:hypothetical protein
VYFATPKIVRVTVLRLSRLFVGRPLSDPLANTQEENKKNTREKEKGGRRKEEDH